MSFPSHSGSPRSGRTAGARLCLCPKEAWGEDTSERAIGPDGGFGDPSFSAGDRGKVAYRRRDLGPPLGPPLGPSLSPLMHRQLAEAAPIDALRRVFA